MVKFDGAEIESIYLIDLGAFKKIGENIGVTTDRYSPPEYLVTEYVYEFQAYKATTSFDVYSLGMTYLEILIPYTRYKNIILSKNVKIDK